MTYKYVDIDVFAQSGIQRTSLERVAVPMSFYSRAKGLLDNRVLNHAAGMLFYNCRSIHMFGMKMALDIIFIDKKGEINKCINSLSPWTLSGSLAAKHTLELQPGFIASHGISVGDRVEINDS